MDRSIGGGGVGSSGGGVYEAADGGGSDGEADTNISTAGGGGGGGSTIGGGSGGGGSGHHPDAGEEGSNQHPARRPMNAFLLFCKKHRKQVREKFPHLENRQVTKILGEWWAELGANEKNGYQELARQLKEAFLRANPDFKWYKIPSQPPRPPPARPSNQKVPRHQQHPTTNSAITFGKLADETLMGRLSTLLSPAPSPVSLASSSSETAAALLTLPSSTVPSSSSSLYQTLIASTHHQPSATDNKHCPSPPPHQYQIHLKHSPPHHPHHHHHHIDHQYHPYDVKPHSLQHQGRHSSAPHSPKPCSPPPLHHPPSSQHQHLHQHPHHHPVQRVCSPHSPQHQDYNNSSLSVYSVADSKHQPTSPPGQACPASDANNRGHPLVHFKRDGGTSEPYSTYVNNRVVVVAAGGGQQGHVTSTAYDGGQVKYEEDRSGDLVTSSVTLNLTDATVFPVTASSSGTASFTRVLRPFVSSSEFQSTSNSTTLCTESTSVVPSTAIPPGAAALSFLPVTVTLAHPPSHNNRAGGVERFVKQEFADIGHLQQQQEHQSFLGVSSNIQPRLATNTLTITAVKQEGGNCGGGSSGQRQACFQLGSSENIPAGDSERRCDLAGSCSTVGVSGATSTPVVSSFSGQGHGTPYFVGREGHCGETISRNPFLSSPVTSSGANVSYVSSGEIARQSVASSSITVNNFVQSPSQAPNSGSILVRNDCVGGSLSGGIDSKNNSPQVQTTATVLRVPSFAAAVNSYGSNTNSINPTNNSYESNANSIVSTNSSSYHTDDISDKEDIAVNALSALAQSSFIIAPSNCDSLQPSAFHQGSGGGNLNSPCANSHVEKTASNGLYLTVNTLPNNSTVSRPSFVEVPTLSHAVEHAAQPYTPFTATSTTEDYQRNASSSVYDNGVPTSTEYLQTIPLQQTPVFPNFGSTTDHLRTSGVVSSGRKQAEASSSESLSSDYTSTNSSVSCNQTQEITSRQSLGGNVSGVFTSKESHPTFRSSFGGYSGNSTAQEKTASPWSPSPGLPYSSSSTSVHQGIISPVSCVAATIPPFANMTPPMPPKKRYTQETMLRPKSPTVAVPNNNNSNSIANNNSNSIANNNNHQVNSAEGLPSVKSSKHTHWRKPALQAAAPSTIASPPSAALSAAPTQITGSSSVPSSPYGQCTTPSLNHSPHHTIQDGVSSASQVPMYAMNHHPANTTSHASMHSPSHHSTQVTNHSPVSTFSQAAPYTIHHTASPPRTIYYSTHPSSPSHSPFSTAAHSPNQPAGSYSSSSPLQMTTSQAASPLSTTSAEASPFSQHRPIALAHHSPIVTPAVGQLCHSHHQPQYCSSSTISPQEPASHLIPKISVYQRTVENNDLERMQRQQQHEQLQQQQQQQRISEQTSDQRGWLQDSRVSEPLVDRLPSVQEGDDEEQPLNLKMVSTTTTQPSANNRAQKLLSGTNTTADKRYGRNKPYNRRKTPPPVDVESRPGSTRRQKVVTTEQNTNRTTGNGSPPTTVELHASMSYSGTPPHLSPASSPSHLNNVVPSQSKHSVAKSRYHVGGYDTDDVVVESIQESSHHQAKHAKGSSEQQLTARLADRPSSSPSTDNSLSSTASASYLPMGEIPSSPSTGAGSSVEGDHDKLIERVIVESLERNSIDKEEEMRKYIEFCRSERGIKIGVLNPKWPKTSTGNNDSLIGVAARHVKKGNHSSSGGGAGSGSPSGRLMNRSRTLQKRTSSPRSESSSNSPVPSSNPPSAPATPPAVAGTPLNTATDASVNNMPSPVVVAETRRNVTSSSRVADSASPTISNHRTRSSTVLTTNKISNLPLKNMVSACRTHPSNTVTENRNSPSPVISSGIKRNASSPVVLAENHASSPPSPVIIIEDECHTPPSTVLSSNTGNDKRKCPLSSAAYKDNTLNRCSSPSDQSHYGNCKSSNSVVSATTAAAKESNSNCSSPIGQSPPLVEDVPQSPVVVSSPSPPFVLPPPPTSDPIELTPVQQQLLVEFTIEEGLKRKTINHEKEALQFKMFCQSQRAAQVGIVQPSSPNTCSEHINKSSKTTGNRIATAAADTINTASRVADTESVAANNSNDRSTVEQNTSLSCDASNESTILLPVRSGGTKSSSKDGVSIGGSENSMNNNSNSGRSSMCGVSALQSMNRTHTTSNIPQRNVHRGNNSNSSSGVVLIDDDVSNDNYRGISAKDSQVRHAAAVVGSSSGVSSSPGKSRVGAAVAGEALASTVLPRRQTAYEGLERHPRKRKADSDREHLVLPKRARGRIGAGGDGGRGGGAGGGGRASRACKGKRYQELMDEGLLQSARRTRARQATARTDETGKEGSEGPDCERLRSSPPPHRTDDSLDRAAPSSRRTLRLLDSPTLPQQPRALLAAPASFLEQDEQGVGEGVLSAPHRSKGAGRWEVGGGVAEDIVEEVEEAVNQHTKFLPEGPGNWLYHHYAATSSVYSTLAPSMEESSVVTVSTASMAAMIEKPPPPPPPSSVPPPTTPQQQQPQTGRGGSCSSSTSASKRSSSTGGAAAAAPNKQYQPDNFDLDAKIEALPYLSFDDFTSRKKEHKRKTSSSSSARSTAAAGSGSNAAAATTTATAAAAASAGSTTSNSLRGGERGVGVLDGEASLTAKPNGYLGGSSLPAHHNHSGGKGSSGGGSSFRHQSSASHSAASSSSSHEPGEAGSGSSRHDPSRLLLSSGVVYHHHSAPPHSSGESAAAARVTAAGPALSPSSKLSSPGGETTACPTSTSFSSGEGSFSGEECGGGEATPLTGSQKRKARKQIITRRDPLSSTNHNAAVVDPGVLSSMGLQTLAEVALQHPTMRT